MEEVRNHYDHHLSNFYSWMFGDYEKFVEYQMILLERHGIQKNVEGTGIALDLGCGSGFQSVALEKLGYQVHAIDLSEPLLEELKLKTTHVKTYLGDMTDFTFADALPHVEVIVCMGDTLTHLSQLNDDQRLILQCFSRLSSGGRLIFSFRDLSQERSPLERFIPVKSDDQRILTCFLEDINAEKVRVFDLLYEKDMDSNNWQLKKSCYEKLKLPVDVVNRWMEEAGFETSIENTPSGLKIISGVKQ